MTKQRPDKCEHPYGWLLVGDTWRCSECLGTKPTPTKSDTTLRKDILLLVKGLVKDFDKSVVPDTYAGKKAIKETTDAILDLLLKRLPEEKPIPMINGEELTVGTGVIRGFNECLKQVRAIIEGGSDE